MLSRIILIVALLSFTVPVYADQSHKIEQYIETNYRRVPSVLAREISIEIVRKSKKYNIPYMIILGVIEVESSFNPMAVSSKGARGLMQVRWSVWNRKLGIKSRFDLHEVDIGIDNGTKIIKLYYSRTSNMENALLKYVGGSKSYVKKVYEAIGRFAVFNEEK